MLKHAVEALIVVWWASTTALSIWWSTELVTLVTRRSLVNPALSGDGADYEAAAAAAGWSVVAAVAHVSCVVPYFSGKFAVRLALFAQTLAYSWTLATLATFSYTYNLHHAALRKGALPTAAVACSLLLCSATM